MLVSQGTNKQVRRLYSSQNMCKRLVRATGNCFPEPVHVGCALLFYGIGVPQAAHTGEKFCQTRPGIQQLQCAQQN